MLWKSHRRKNRRHEGLFPFQQLEPRLPLAGNVTIVQNGDLVTLTGDAAANGVEIHKTVFGFLRITGIPAGSPSSPTALVVEGRATEQTLLLGVSRLQVVLGRGDDSVTIGSQGEANLLPSVFSSLSVDLGDGENQFSGHGLNVIGDAEVRSGRHDDTVLIEDANLGSLSMMTGQGNDYLSLTRRIDVHGAVSIDGFRGNDVISMREQVLMRSTCGILGGGENDIVEMKDGVVVQSDLTVDFGGGNDGFYADNTVGVAGRMTLVGQTGNDEVYLENSFAVLGDLSIDVGGGNDQVVVRDGVSFGGNATIQLGGGESDEFLEATRIDGQIVQVVGNLTILKQGGRARAVSVGDVPDGRPRFRIGGDFIVEAGGEAELFIVAEVGRDVNVQATGGAVSATIYKSVVGRNVSIVTGDSEDFVWIKGATVAGSVRIETRGSSDYAKFEDIDVSGGTTLALGSGSDEMTVRGTFRTSGSFDGGAGRRDRVRYPQGLLGLAPLLVNFETTSVE